MRAPSFLSPCKACGRDLVAGLCAFCDKAVPEPVLIGQGERTFRCVERHPGLSMYELAEILGDTSEQALVNLTGMLARLCRVGALRHEGTRNERTYYPADETKIPRRKLEPKVKTPPRRKHTTSESAKAKIKERRERYLAAGLCLWCAKPRDVEGRNRCMACIEKGRASKWLYSTSEKGRKKVAKRLRRKYKRYAERNRKGKRELYEFYRNAGICVRCHSADATVGANCDSCTEKHRESSRQTMQRKSKERVEAGLCRRCGLVPFVEGGTACQPCRDKVSAWKRKRKELT